MGAGKLAAWVHVRNPETDAMEAFGPDSDLPDWAAGQITNPKAWEGGVVPEIGDSGPKVPSGRAGDKAWVKYAKVNGVDVAEGAKKADVIAALKSADVATE